MTRKQTSTLALLVLSLQQELKRRSERAKKRLEKQFEIHNLWIKKAVDFLRDVDTVLHHAKNKKNDYDN